MKALMKFLLTLYVIIGTAVFILACLAPYINPRHSSILYFAGLAFPIVVVNFILIALYMGIGKKKFIFLFLLIPGIVFGLNYLSIGKSADNSEEKIITVHTLNAYSTNLLHENEASYNAWKTYLSDENHQPDVVCVQELPQNILDIYPTIESYHVFKRDKSNLKIATHYPILEGGEIKDAAGIRFAIFADLIIDSDTVRIYNFHLFSNKISGWLKTAESTDSPGPEKIIKGGDRIKKRIFEAATKRAAQAKKLNWHMDACPYKIIACGDMNETAQSFSYRQIKSKLSDTFRKGSMGTHPTYRKNPSWVRIDYIFSDPSFDIEAYEVLPYDISDHRIVMTTLASNKK